MSENARILVVEDERIIAMDIVGQLQDCGYDVVGTATTSAEALRLVETKAPDLVIMDIVLDGDDDGIEAAAVIWKQYSIPVVYLTAYTTSNILERAKHTSPFGYLVKPFDSKELHATIQMALHHSRLEQPRARPANSLRRTLQTLRSPQTKPTDESAEAERIGSLSPRERQVLELFLRGYGTGTIANRLTVSAQTVRNHLKNTCRKFDVHSQIELRELFAFDQVENNVN